MFEVNYNYPALFEDMTAKNEMDTAAYTMAKCTKSCFMSMKENSLLPTEERCLRNCFVKSADFQNYFDSELKYTIRNIKMQD